MQRPEASLGRSGKRRFLADEAGGAAMMFGLMLPGLLGLAGAVVDYSRLSSARGHLQSIADSAALAAVREFRLGNTSLPLVVSRADLHAKAGLKMHDIPGTVEATGDTSRRTITVAMTATIPLSVMGMLGIAGSDVRVSATARMVGGSPLCVIGLDTRANQSLLMDKRARLEAPGCAVYSNSSKPNGLMAKNDASMRAGFICSAGGKSSPGPGSFSPQPQTDCPPIPDPLLARTLPTHGVCLDRNLVINGGAPTLQPGTYCDGVTITGGARVTLQPGVYVFRDGPLRVTGAASLTGQNVALHFSGANAELALETQSSVSLTAPRGGDMGGLLITEDRAGPGNLRHRIMSDDARTLLGTIYLPRSEFHVGASSPVADRSAYTIVVARVFTLSEGPTMVLNTNYGATDIPVPNGVGPSGGSAQLTQ